MSAKPATFVQTLGAILLIVGTSIGGGMLALPVATAYLGFLPSVLYLIITWLMMTLGALLILEVNACLPIGNNLISMAGATIGKVGQALAWISYLFLLYSLLSAYVAAGQDVMHTLLGYLGWNIPEHWAALIFLLIFSSIVACGIQKVDWVNRLIMAVKFFAYLAMVFFTLPFVRGPHLMQGPLGISVTLSTLMIMITSYGFAIIVPSLRLYFRDNIQKLRQVTLIGSFIPLVFYLLWEAVIFGVLPTTGKYSLEALTTSTQPVSTLMHVLSHIADKSWMVYIANIFTSVCVITAFLGVSLCLMDFLADGFRTRKQGMAGVMIYLATFVPPLVLALFAQKLFVYGLSFAGIFCVFLLILLPAWMAWCGRYSRKFEHPYRVFGGKPLLVILMLASVALLLWEVIRKFLF